MQKKPKHIRQTLKNLIEIKQLVSLFYKELTPNYKDEQESHNFWEFVYVDSGECTVIANGSDRYKLKKGQMFLHKPNELHQLDEYDKTAANILIVSFSCISPAMSAFTNYRFTLSKECKDILSKLVKEFINSPQYIQNTAVATHSFNIAKTGLTDTIGYQQCIKMYLELLFITLLRQENNIIEKPEFFSSRDDYHNSLCNNIINYLNKNLYNSITINKLCHDLFYGKTTACAQFKKHTGHTIMEYYCSLKISESKKLLRNTDYKITEIAEKLGFGSLYYFSNVFKEKTGLTPTEYRLRI